MQLIEKVSVIGTDATIDPTALSGYCRGLSVEVGLPVSAAYPRRGKELVNMIVNLDETSGAVICADNVDQHKWILQSLDAIPKARIALVDFSSATRPRDPGIAASGVTSIRGRGIDGVRWAARSVIARGTMTFVTESYGELVDQVGDLRLPESGGGPFAVAVLLHGGGWRECWERDLMDRIAVDLTKRGYATWNLEYRRVGPSGGGWPQTLVDVANGVDAVSVLAEKYPVNPDRVILIGHSAGGQLSLWAAGRGGLPAGSPGANPAISVGAAVSISGAVDLCELGRRGTVYDSVAGFIGGLPEDMPERYAIASPLNSLPLRPCKVLVAYGTAESMDLIDSSRRYCTTAYEVGDDIEELALQGADHFQVIDTRSVAWQCIAGSLERSFPASDLPARTT